MNLHRPLPMASANVLHRLPTPSSESFLVARNGFQIRLADTTEKRSQVNALINRMYSWRGYQNEPPSFPHHLHDQTTLQACNGLETLGTLTLNIDSERGLLADQLYPKEVDALRRRGATVCELTGLAVCKRDNSSELLASLFHLSHILGHRLHRASDAVIEINPRHSLFYQRTLGFRQIGERRTCSRVNAPAVLLHIETDFVEEQIASLGNQAKSKGRSLYPFFFNRSETEILGQQMLAMHRDTVGTHDLLVPGEKRKTAQTKSIGSPQHLI